MKTGSRIWQINGIRLTKKNMKEKIDSLILSHNKQQDPRSLNYQLFVKKWSKKNEKLNLNGMGQ